MIDQAITAYRELHTEFDPSNAMQLARLIEHLVFHHHAAAPNREVARQAVREYLARRGDDDVLSDCMPTLEPVDGDSVVGRNGFKPERNSK